MGCRRGGRLANVARRIFSPCRARHAAPRICLPKARSRSAVQRSYSYYCYYGGKVFDANGRQVTHLGRYSSKDFRGKSELETSYRENDGRTVVIKNGLLDGMRAKFDASVTAAWTGNGQGGWLRRNNDRAYEVAQLIPVGADRTLLEVSVNGAAPAGFERLEPPQESGGKTTYFVKREDGHETMRISKVGEEWKVERRIHLPYYNLKTSTYCCRGRRYTRTTKQWGIKDAWIADQGYEISVRQATTAVAKITERQPDLKVQAVIKNVMLCQRDANTPQAGGINFHMEIIGKRFRQDRDGFNEGPGGGGYSAFPEYGDSPPTIEAAAAEIMQKVSRIKRPGDRPGGPASAFLQAYQRNLVELLTYSNRFLDSAHTGVVGEKLKMLRSEHEQAAAVDEELQNLDPEERSIEIRQRVKADFVRWYIAQVNEKLAAEWGKEENGGFSLADVFGKGPADRSFTLSANPDSMSFEPFDGVHLAENTHLNPADFNKTYSEEDPTETTFVDWTGDLGSNNSGRMAACFITQGHDYKVYQSSQADFVALHWQRPDESLTGVQQEVEQWMESIVETVTRHSQSGYSSGSMVSYPEMPEYYGQHRQQAVSAMAQIIEHEADLADGSVASVWHSFQNDGVWFFKDSQKDRVIKAWDRFDMLKSLKQAHPEAYDKLAHAVPEILHITDPATVPLEQQSSPGPLAHGWGNALTEQFVSLKFPETF